jgi:hypothetical protein
MNVIFRNIGGAMGGQISASILTAAVAVGGFPTEDAFVDSFWLAGGMLLLGFVAALLVPRPKAVGVAQPEAAPVG